MGSESLAAKLARLSKVQQSLAEEQAKLAHQDTRRKPGLLHSLRGIEVQSVTPRMKKPCYQCGKLPEVRRLVVKTGSGRSGSSQVYCMKDGDGFLLLARQEFLRAMSFLEDGYVLPELRQPTELGTANVGIRLPRTTKPDDIFEG